MKRVKVTLIGSKSDLIQPLLNTAQQNNLEVQCINRNDWDLENPIIPELVLENILTFQPDSLLFAAGANKPISLCEPLSEIVSRIETHISINCTSFISFSIAVQQVLRKPLKSIHAISSLYGTYGRRTRLPYSVSKHALEGAIKCLATEYKDTQVLGYRPGFFSTTLTARNLSKDSQMALIKKIPVERFGLPEEISRIITQNILNPSPYMTGVCLTIDGGMRAGGFFDVK